MEDTKNVGTVSIKPTWESIVQMLIVLLENGGESGKAYARKTLLNMARKLDSQLDSIDEVAA